MKKWGCLFILYCLVPIVVFGQEVKITEVKYIRHSLNASADVSCNGLILFRIYPKFIENLIFKSTAEPIHVEANPQQRTYYFEIRPTSKSQILTVIGNGFSKNVIVGRVDSSSYREYHLNWLPNHFVDSIVSIKAQEIQDSVLQIYRDSIQKPKKQLIKDWSRDFKLIMGVSNGIVAGEIFGFYGELKFGEKSGIALEGGYCPGFNDMYDERWSGGVKGYYKYWFLSTHYGTTTIVLNKNPAFKINDDGSFFLKGRRSSHRIGVTLLCGYDRNWKWLHFTSGIGGTLTTSSKPKFLPAWNIGVGISMTELVAN